MEQIIDINSKSQQKFVNDKVRWQAKGTIALMRGLIKPQLNKPFNINDFSRFASRFDAITAKNVNDLDIQDVNANGIPARWINSPSKNKTVILYLHGGVLRL